MFGFLLFVVAGLLSPTWAFLFFDQASSTRTAVECFDLCMTNAECSAINFYFDYADPLNGKCVQFDKNSYVDQSCGLDSLTAAYLTDDAIVKIHGFDVLLKTDHQRVINGPDNEVDCFNECLLDMQCAAISFTYQDTNDQAVCLFVPHGYQTSYADGWMTKYKSSEFEVVSGLNLSNPDDSNLISAIKTSVSSTPQAYQCHSACQNNDACRGVTYRANESPDCFLYSSLAEGVDQGALSLIKYDPRAEVHHETRLYNHYNKYFNVLTLSACFNLCLADVKCVAVTYPPGLEHACFMHDSSYAVKRFSGWRSAFKVQPDATVRYGYKTGNYYKMVDNCGSCQVACSSDPSCASCKSTPAENSLCSNKCFLYDIDETVQDPQDWIAIFKTTKN
jgi:hypothetical protein